MLTPNEEKREYLKRKGFHVTHFPISKEAFCTNMNFGVSTTLEQYLTLCVCLLGLKRALIFGQIYVVDFCGFGIICILVRSNIEGRRYGV